MTLIRTSDTEALLRKPPCIRVYINAPKKNKKLANRDASKFANHDIPKQPQGEIRLSQRAQKAGISKIEVDQNVKDARSILVNILIVAYAAQEGILLVEDLNYLPGTTANLILQAQISK